MSKLSNKTIVIIAFALIIIGFFIIAGDYLKYKKNKAYQTISVSLFVGEDDEKKDNTPQIVNDDTPPTPNSDGFIGVLTIDKINLSQGFLDKDNKDNNVDKNITILPVSSYPNEKNGNVILASHSGNSSIAYFKHLYKLSVGDKAVIDYNGKKYTYKIDNIYNEVKDGNVTIYRDVTKNTLTMVTCTKNDNYHQTIYIAYLESVK